MMNKELYKREVYKKYKEVDMNKFMDKGEKKYINYLKLVATIVICIGIFGGTGYAGIEIYKTFISQEKVSSRIEDGMDLSTNEKYLEHQYEFEYKLIDNYNDYLFYKSMWPQLVEMEEKEFENYIILLAITHADTLKGFNIVDVYADDNTMYVNFDVDKTEDINKDFMASKIEKRLERENIEFKQMYHDKAYGNFVKITDIPEDYSIQNAIDDGCFAIDNGDVVSNNKEALKEFVENTESGKKEFIRICGTWITNIIKENEYCYVCDIEYDGTSYITNYRILRGETDNTIRDNFIYDKEYSKIKFEVIHPKTELIHQNTEAFLRLWNIEGGEELQIVYNYSE